MRRRTIGALALLVITCVAPATAQTGQTLVVRATAEPCLIVRAEPASSAEKLTCIPPGTQVVGIAAAPYWRRIRLDDGREGWAAKKYLEATSAGDTIPSSTTIPEDAWLEIHFVDVGQGDGIWIHTYDDGIPGNGRFEGKNIVIDGGPDSSSTNPFYRYLKERAYEGATIDALLLTHPHNDHYPGAYSVLRHFDVCDYYDPAYPKGGDYTDFLAAARVGHCGGAATPVHLGKAQFGQPSWGSELKVEFLYAWPGDAAGLGGSDTNTVENNASIVMKLTYGTQSFLFMGDAEGKKREGPPDTPKYVEARLLGDTATAAKLKSTLIKAAHHGSETSGTTPFIDAVDPSIVVVMSGRRKFGTRFLPDKTALQRYCDHNPAIRIYRTDQDDEAEHRTVNNDEDGDNVVVRSNGKQTVVQALSGGSPFAPTACSP